MKIGVLGNCQAHGVADCIRLLAPHVEVVARSVSLADGENAEVIEAIAAEIAMCDLALVQTLEEAQPRLAGLFAAALKRSGLRSRRWPPVIFRGFHPDCVYVMRNGRAIDGVVGPYHSALLCAAWSEGLPAERAARLFNAFSYAALGYFDAFDEAAGLFASQTQRHGFDFSSFLNGPSVPFMHTINHPRIEILQSVAIQALDLGGIAHEAFAPLPTDELAHGPVWPTYPELARRRSWTPASASWSLQDLEAVTQRAYTSLDQLADHSLGEPDRPGEQAILRARAFIKTHVIAAR